VTGDVRIFEPETRPVIGGVSISTVNPSAGTGTLGTICYEVGSGRPLFLSCWHVLNFGSKVGEEIVQPGLVDSGTYPADAIGTLYRSIPINYSGPNFVDAAVGIPTSPDLLGSASFEGISSPAIVSSIANPVVTSTLVKSGRTTGVTYGTVLDTSAIMKVNGYPGGSALFDDCIVCGPMSNPGDSGSVALDSFGAAVGLLFAGSDTITIYNKMTNVCRMLNITMNPNGILTLPPGGPLLPKGSPLNYLIPIGIGVSIFALSYKFLRH